MNMTRNGHRHGHRIGHPRGRCPVTCGHRAWVESYYAARQLAESERESVTGNWPGDLADYAARRPPLPTLHDWMIHR